MGATAALDKQPGECVRQVAWWKHRLARCARFLTGNNLLETPLSILSAAVLVMSASVVVTGLGNVHRERRATYVQEIEKPPDHRPALLNAPHAKSPKMSTLGIPSSSLPAAVLSLTVNANVQDDGLAITKTG